MDITQFRWLRQPQACIVQDGRIEVTTRPYTDLWQRTYYHFRNDNAPVLQMETEEKFFPSWCEPTFMVAIHALTNAVS